MRQLLSALRFPSGRVPTLFDVMCLGVVIAALGLILSVPAAAQERFVTILAENDIIGGTDRDYTNGMRLSVLGRNSGQDGVTGAIGRRLLGARVQDDVFGGFAIGHAIYTPASYRNDFDMPDQHPYAGFLQLDGEVLRVGAGVLERATLQLGLVGPSAGGEQVQTTWHEATSSDIPMGWDHQLRDEATIGVSYDRMARTFAGSGYGRGAELATAGGVVLGTALTQAHVGALFRYGDDLGDDFGPSRARPGISGADVFDAADGGSWYILTSVQARAVARNIVLDGNTFIQGGPGVARETMVYEAQTGLVVRTGAARIAFSLVRRTREFATQSSGQLFGALSISRAL